MAQIIANEKHQGSLVNHTSFRFSCNIDATEKNLLEYERYLNQIEDSLDTSKEMQLKKKIAGRFSSEVAYKILTQVQFKTNHDDSFITALVPNRLYLESVRTEGLGNRQADNLSKSQITYLSEQLEAVYGVNGYYVQMEEGVEGRTEERVEDKDEILIPPPRFKTCHIDHREKPIDILEAGSKLNKTDENTVWHQIRQGLREEFGEVVDTTWFSKAVATKCNKTNTLTLTMPTRFMADWVCNNYSHVIRRISKECGAKIVEYGYE